MPGRTDLRSQPQALPESAMARPLGWTPLRALQCGIYALLWRACLIVLLPAAPVGDPYTPVGNSYAQHAEFLACH